MPRFEPFRAVRYSTTDLSPVSSPPYDVFDVGTRSIFADRHPHNVVQIDYPIESEGPHRYEKAASTLNEWLRTKVLIADSTPSFTIYRMTFTTETGERRTTTGVIGALEVVDLGAPGVLPHERTTPKAHSDRLDLTRATRANLSPVWGLSLTMGLTAHLQEAGELVGECVDEDGVLHRVERVTDPDRINSIRAAVSSNPVLIADGHHRYSVSRTFREEERSRHSSAGDLTMTYVAELVQEQLSIAAIHRLIDAPPGQVLAELTKFFDVVQDVEVSPETLRHMEESGCICLVRPDGLGTLLRANEEKLATVRALDSARLEHALGSLVENITYQHGVQQLLSELRTGHGQVGVLIRPVSISEIQRTADTGELMPPKSTFFTPKLRTGLVMRSLDLN